MPSSTEITDKTEVLVTRNLGKFYLTLDQAIEIKNRLQSDTTRAIAIEGNLIMLSDIVGIVHGSQLKDAERSKRGEWKCEKHNNWVPKGNRCGYCGG